jgi:site-specific DNA-methyltransferase (adenine-specific)
MSEVVTIGDATLYHGDCLAILPTLPEVDAVITDPPYGMGWKAINPGATQHVNSGGRRRGGASSRHEGLTVVGDDKPFDPSPLLTFPKVIMWGANHYGARLPVGTTLVWIKRMDDGFGSFLSDAELAFMKGGHGVYCFRDLTGKAEDRMGQREHPTQKPVRLMRWCVEQAGNPARVLDPYMGSGTTGVACAQLGRKFVGVEIEKKYFDMACERIDNAYRQQRMFA